MRLFSPSTILLLLGLGFGITTYAGPGDTTTVQTFTFGSPQESKFLFPDSTHRWGKILLYYTLKCNPNQSPACGEWDYLTYTYLYKHTGVWDSILYTHPNYTYNGTTPDSLIYMNQTAWAYQPYFEYSNNTVPQVTVVVGDSNRTGNLFQASYHDVRNQSLWKGSELVSAGLTPGQLTGLQLKFMATGPTPKKFILRLKQTTLDSLGSGSYENSGFTTVCEQTSFIPATGWQTIPFTYPFIWDGISNVIVDFSFSDLSGAGSIINAADSVSPEISIRSDEKEAFLKFHDMDFLNVPASVFIEIDSAITIAFWQFGDSILQPQNNTIFEGLDSTGARVLNVHLPWSDGKIYWDAGRTSTGYDRMSKAAADPSQYRGKWNHWAFTKDSRKGWMKIFLNGQQWFFAVGKFKPMNGVTQFRIGSSGTGNDLFYDGYIDDFSIWNKALNDTAIREIMYRDIQPSNPDYANLLTYYKFNDGEGFLAGDAAPGNHPASLIGYPEWQSYHGKDRFRNLEASALRPTIKFEQGLYAPALLDSTLMVDTLSQPPIMIVMYEDTLHPYIPTDTLAKFHAYYNNYVYDSAGRALDSVLVTPDGILRRIDHGYYGAPFEVTERYELARYITPYGNNLSLGNGWTWVFDITDYAPLLRDSVHLAAGNWQELLDMKVKMIEGIPPRDVLGIRNIYTGSHGYDKAESHNLPPVKVKIDNNVKNARLKMRITGHGFGGNLNCSEFCPRNNTLYVNGALAYNHWVWRDDCGLNPLYPQGGTWLYDRAEWCPGAEVRTANFELSDFIVPNDTLIIDYDLQSGYNWNGQGSYPYYQIESQLITYGKPNFNLDAALEEVISPNLDNLYNRYNPMCGSPIIAIKNNGTDTLKNMDISYGPIGIPKLQLYHWSGLLAFQDTVRVALPPVDWSSWTAGDNRFIFTVLNPNNGEDEYAYDNSMTAPFNIPPTYDNILRFNFKSNHMASALSWKLEDQDGKILYQNGELVENTEYNDTLELNKGCYMLIVGNSEGEGLSYWANMPPYGNGTSGYARLYDMTGKLVKTLQADFGRRIVQCFTVGMTIDVPETNPFGYINIHPNPSNGVFTLSVLFERSQDIQVIIHTLLGNEVFNRSYPQAKQMNIPIDLHAYPKGLYLVSVTSTNGSVVKKIMIR